MNPRRVLSKALLLLFGLSPFATAALAQERSTDNVRWKLFFDQMFALELKKELQGRPNAEAELQKALKRYTAYTDKTFNQSIDQVLTASTSAEAYKLRQEIFDNEASYKAIQNLDFNLSVPASVQSDPAVKAYLAQIKALASRGIAADENFFQTAEAKNLISALSQAGGKANGQEVALLMIPGYAAHAIKFGIFPELVGDMNKLYGRPEARPILADSGNGLDVTYEDFKTFYSRSDATGRPFDILTPAGWEMGNTVGFNKETSDLIAEWIKNLPAAYANKKLILFGYSKGAPIILEMLERHPELKTRVLGVITYAGVIQGTHVARDGKNLLEGLLGNRTVGEAVDRVKEKGAEKSIEGLAPFIGPLDLSFIQIPKIKELLDIYGFDSTNLQKQSDRIIDGRELREILDGAKDLHPLTRSLWNVRYLNDQLLPANSFFFNLSAVTDISQFSTRPALSTTKVREWNLLTPKLNDDGKIDWKSFSLDAWFLYLSSLGGFKTAPGGLYDTQVDLQHTKVPMLDQSPFSASLKPEELQALWDDPEAQAVLRKAGIGNVEALSSTPRSKVFAGLRNIRSYDLGEFKGHHWSLFHQAFRVPSDISTDYAVWEFPRLAFMRAILQTLALYNLIQANESEGGKPL